MISRYKPRVWTVAMSRDAAVCQGLAFSYGVYTSQPDDEPENWRDYAGRWLHDHQVPGHLALLVAGPSPGRPNADYRLEFLNFAVPKF